jgi:DnaJ like chaperone protein
MSVWQSILSGAAQIFGPPAKLSKGGEAGPIEQTDLVVALVALGAKMAKADGQVRLEDIKAFRRVFQPEPSSETQVARFFDLARQTTLGFERYARIVAKHFRAKPAALEDVLDGLFHIALADSIVTEEEHAFLERVSEIFGFSEREYDRIRSSNLGVDPTNPYLILGVDEDVSDEGLKKAYRRMAAANHPDRLVARGAPRELMGLANHKMAVINKAYADIVAQRAGRFAIKRGLPEN